jgi:membrane protein YqaA with SNARE-associated domain
VKLFKPLYERALQWARHPRAPAILGGLSFFEAFIFPIPPEVMLAPMTLSQPKRGLWFASISLFWSVWGCLVGYALGHFFFHLVEPVLQNLNLMERYEEVRKMAAENGFWFLLVGGFVPVPFKLLTLASGAVGMPMLPFLAGAIIGRGKRVYLVAGAIMWGGEKAEATLHKYIEPIGWAAVVLLVGLVLAIKFWP